MFKEEILENENRRKIYSAIETNPGVHLRELQRILDIPVTTLEYHLGYMMRKNIIFAEIDEHYKRFYAKPLNNEDKKILAAIRQQRLRELVIFTLIHKKVKFQSFADYFKLPNSTLSFYLKYLVEKGIFDKYKIGYENIYTVKNENNVAKVLVAYRAGFLDRLIDKTLATWLEAYSKDKK